MTSNRTKSPDMYIGIMKNLQDRFLSKEEKRMLLNVYGVLRKEAGLSVEAAAARAADLCGVSVGALFSAKKEFDENFGTKIPNRSLDPLGNASVQCDNNQVEKTNLPELQPCNTKVYFAAKEKIEMLGTNGNTTIEPVVEAFKKDPNLPNLDDSGIGHVVKQLNLTSYMSHVAPKPVEVQRKWDTQIEVIHLDEATACGPTTSAAVSNFHTSDCHIACRDVGRVPDDLGMTSQPSEMILPDAGEREGTEAPSRPFEFHACSLTGVKAEEEEEAAFGVKREAVDPDGVFLNGGDYPAVESRKETGERDDSGFGSRSMPEGVDTSFVSVLPENPKHSFGNLSAYASVPATESVGGVNDQTLPFAGILVYGRNAINSSSATDASVPNGVDYVGDVPEDPSAILPATADVDPPPQWRPFYGTRRPRDRRYRSCKACRRMFDHRGPLCEHLEGRAGGRRQHPPVVCRYCPRSFPGPGGREFVQHTMYEHTMRSLACDFCECSFNSAQRLVRHVASAHMEAFLEQQGVVAVET